MFKSSSLCSAIQPIRLYWSTLATPRLKACFQKKNGTRVLCIFLETRRHAGTGNMKIKIIRWGIFEKNDIENCNYHHFVFGYGGIMR